MKRLKNCKICPRQCGADRFSDKLGYCKSNAGFNVGAICLHRGEEPVLSGTIGICNVFFTHCNIQCRYCQNFQISRNRGNMIEYSFDLNQLIEKIILLLDKGCNILGFVSPSHVIPQMQAVILRLRELGKNPVIVMNTNAYDRVEILKELEGLVDIYLPDFKYADAELGAEYSDVSDYPDVAIRAIREMYRQKGSMLYVNEDNGVARSGLIIRHLVLPGHVDNSIAVMQKIAEEISTSVHISLMSQYYPTESVRNHPILGKKISLKEYEIVIEEMRRLGFYKGWIQESDSFQHYQPDFIQTHPFELKSQE